MNYLEIRSIFNNVAMYKPVNQYLECYFRSDLAHSSIPILEKSKIVETFPLSYMNELVEKAINEGKVEYASTSGTSSEKLLLMRPKNWWTDEFQRGYKYSEELKNFSMYKDRKACLSTAVCSGNTCFMSNPDFQERIIGNTLYLNTKQDPNLWNKEDIVNFGKELHDYAAELLEVDPVYLAIYLKKREEFLISDELYQPKLIICSYEFLTEGNIQYLQRNFDCPILSLYGSTELGVLFIQNETGTYSRCPEKSIVEIVPVNLEKRLYELVVTSWKNEYMPLLRYKTNDVVKLSEKNHILYNQKKKFKFMEHESLDIESFHGRMNDVFYTDDGGLITIAMLDEKLQSCNWTPWQYQLCIKNERITFIYVKHDHSDLEFEADENFMFLKNWFHKHVDFDFVSVKFIRNEGSGKFQIVKGNNAHKECKV